MPISEMDYNNKVIYAILVIVSLEIFGQRHKFYQFPNYIKQKRRNQIMPDVVSFF
jgi:hypothetical protein